MIKAVIFDCFGVIITDALEALSAELVARNPQAAQELKDIITASNRGIMDTGESRRRVAGLLNLSYEEYRQSIRAGEVKDEQLLRYITGLRKHYKTAMLSNINGGGLAIRFGKDELETYFDAVVASGDIGFAKPEAQAYEYVAYQLGERLDECVFLDDREDYCAGAQAVGMKAIKYENFTQAKAELEKLLDNPER